MYVSTLRNKMKLITLIVVVLIIIIIIIISINVDGSSVVQGVQKFGSIFRRVLKIAKSDY